MNKRNLSAEKTALVEELLATKSAGKATRRRLSALGEKLAPEILRLVAAAELEEEARRASEPASSKGLEGGRPALEKERPSREEISRRPPEGTDVTACCNELVVRLEKIRIVRLTTPRAFKDNVVVTALSHGRVMSPSPVPFAWPLDEDAEIDAKDMDTGEICRETPLIARVEPGQNCEYSLDTDIVFWEEDPEEIGDLLQQATLQLISSLAAQQGIAMPATTSNLIDQLVRRITRTLGLTDDRMGAYTFTLAGRLNAAKALKEHAWSPPWGNTYDHEEIDWNTVRLSQTFESNGGKWETSILVQRICMD